jgi:hypothetical protein
LNKKIEALEKNTTLDNEEKSGRSYLKYAIFVLGLGLTASVIIIYQKQIATETVLVETAVQNK